MTSPLPKQFVPICDLLYGKCSFPDLQDLQLHPCKCYFYMLMSFLNIFVAHRGKRLWTWSKPIGALHGHWSLLWSARRSQAAPAQTSPHHQAKCLLSQNGFVGFLIVYVLNSNFWPCQRFCWGFCVHGAWMSREANPLVQSFLSEPGFVFPLEAHRWLWKGNGSWRKSLSCLFCHQAGLNSFCQPSLTNFYY